MKNLILVVSIASIVSACGKSEAISLELSKAKKIESELVCNLPQGLQDHRPILGIAIHDTAREKLAREYIELKRREKISEGKWDLAATFFYTEQTNLAMLKGNLASDKEKIRSWLRNYEEGKKLFNVPIDEVVQKQANFFTETCGQWIMENERIQKKTAALEKLRAESVQSWLDPKKRLPCPIHEKPGCKS